LPAHATRGHRNIRDLICVPHRAGRVGSLDPFHGQPVPKPLALTMPGARAISPRYVRRGQATLDGPGTMSRQRGLVWLVYAWRVLSGRRRPECGREGLEVRHRRQDWVDGPLVLL